MREMSPSEQQRPLAFSAVRSKRSHAAESEEAETRRKKTQETQGKERELPRRILFCN
jgi:hypothetical protein